MVNKFSATRESSGYGTSRFSVTRNAAFFFSCGWCCINYKREKTDRVLVWGGVFMAVIINTIMRTNQSCKYYLELQYSNSLNEHGSMVA